LGLIGAGLLAFAGLTRVHAAYLSSQLQGGPVDLAIPPMRQQSRGTSCGEAVIVMAYNYSHPQASLSEASVIEYAIAAGYFTEQREPFTSPADMRRIADHYAPGSTSGNAVAASLGLEVLFQSLHAGEPVIIDVLTRLDDPESDAHFVLVTGLARDPTRADAILVTYNDPFTGQTRTADWAGDTGIWHAWQNNGDPGGAGWWMVIR
jgi:hypothetical protein